MRNGGVRQRVASRLKTTYMFADNLSLNPSTHIWWFTITYNSSSREPSSLFSTLQATARASAYLSRHTHTCTHAHVYTHTYTQIKNKTFNKIIEPNTGFLFNYFPLLLFMQALEHHLEHTSNRSIVLSCCILLKMTHDK